MNNCITYALAYPFTHISKIRQLGTDQIFLASTPFFPAYPFFLGASAICNFAFAGWMIYYFITASINECYSGVTIGIQIMACTYPVYQIIIFLVLMVSISTSKYNCLKAFIILTFTIISTCFGFGGLGVVYLCMVNRTAPYAIGSSFITQNYFVQMIVYAMLIFITSYILLVPLSSCLQEKKGDKNQLRCKTFLIVLSVFLQIILLIGTIFFVGIALGGIPILFYLLSGITQTDPMTENKFFGLAINCLVSPFGVMLIVLVLKNFVGCGQEKQMTVNQSKISKQSGFKQIELNSSKVSSNEKSINQTTQRNPINLDDTITSSKENKREILLQSNKSKQFKEQGFMSKIKRSNALTALTKK